jgi:hypothetical protein
MHTNLFALLVPLLLASCDGFQLPSLSEAEGPKQEQRFTAELDGRSIALFIREDTVYGAKPVRFLTLDDPLEEGPMKSMAYITDPDSLSAGFSAGKDTGTPCRIDGTRNAEGQWMLTYARGQNTSPAALTFHENPTALVFERKDYSSAAQTSEPTGESDIAPGLVNGMASISVHTYRITDRVSGMPHPVDDFLRKFICGVKSYEEFSTVGEGDVGGTSYSVDLPHRSDDRVVFRVERSYYEEGMAHDQMGSRLLNYDLVGNKEVKLQDVVSPSEQGRLKAIVKKAFYAKYTDRSMRNNTFEFTDNVAFLRNGIQFLWQPYQMGPFVMGYMDVTIPYAELTGILDPSVPFAKQLAATN